MKYEDLVEHLKFYDKASKDYLKYSQGRSEYDQECAGFISGDLHETYEIIHSSLGNSKENFDMITKFIEEHCPNSFNIMISKLDSTPDNYFTLYDLCREINFRREDNFIFPTECLDRIKIYR